MHTQDSSLLLILSNAHLKPWPKTNSQFLPQKSPKFIYEELKKKKKNEKGLIYTIVIKLGEKTSMNVTYRNSLTD